MGQLTSMTEINKNAPITSLYPTHADALKKTNILPNKIPTVQELYKQELERKEIQEKKEEEKIEDRINARSTLFLATHVLYQSTGEIPWGSSGK
eukprot:11034298-Ditylum_brightwellii.AAC.1